MAKAQILSCVISHHCWGQWKRESSLPRRRGSFQPSRCGGQKGGVTLLWVVWQQLGQALYFVQFCLWYCCCCCLFSYLNVSSKFFYRSLSSLSFLLPILLPNALQQGGERNGRAGSEQHVIWKVSVEALNRGIPKPQQMKKSESHFWIALRKPEGKDLIEITSTLVSYFSKESL